MAPSSAETDPRRQLVERIIISQGFARSPRLSSFLQCVCHLAREGRHNDINEQYLGTAVFGRKNDFDTGIDSIVRSHATRLRNRLERYFHEEGADELWKLTIPKGSYIPVFELRHPAQIEAEETQVEPEDTSSARALPIPSSSAPSENASVSPNATTLVHALSWGLAASLLLSALLALYIFREHKPATAMAGTVKESTRLFWSQLFNRDEHTLVINADSGLVMLQGLTNQRIDLQSYLNGSYLTPLSTWKTHNPELLDLGTRRYTTVVDLRINQKILQMTGTHLENTTFVYSRDLRPDELKNGNLILLGTYESTPWVQLFEHEMNFSFQNDLEKGTFAALNRSPLPGEQKSYSTYRADPEKVVYGVVAYRPSLNGRDKVLILEGQSMAGTETASDFVFDDGYLLPFLHSIQRSDGSIPYFEILLRSRSMRGESSRLEIVAQRVETR